MATTPNNRKQAKPIQAMPDSTARLFYQIIHENYGLAQALSAHLKKERACISKRDFEGHKKILDEKVNCVNRLGQAEQHLILLFKKMGIKDFGSTNKDPNSIKKNLDSAKIDALIATISSSHQSMIRKDWIALKSELSLCKQLNSINGRIIQLFA